jgi:anti-sigma factor ChrR (cupin superfamily)
MTLHVTIEELEALRRGELPPDDPASIAAHLRECVDCRERLPAVDSVAAALVSDFSAGEHPEIDELFDYADGTLSRERSGEIEEHLRDCPECSTDVADARHERNNSLPAAGPSYVWQIAAAIVIVIAAAAFWFAQRQPATPDRPPVARVTPPTREAHEWDQLVAEVRQMHGIAMPDILRRLRGHSEAFRGARATSEAIHPSPEAIVVLSQQPELTWNAAKRERYIVSIACGDQLVATSEPVSGGRWTPPRPLPRGADCVWQLERVSDHEILPSPPAPQPAFHILDDASLAMIRKAESQQPPDPFAVGLLYARAGLQKEAAAALSTYVSEHPSDRVASDVLQSIERW